MAIDSKYGQIDITGIDYFEPVFLFRGQDALLPMILAYYLEVCKESGASEHHLEAIQGARQKVIDWQRDHMWDVKIPDTTRDQITFE